MRKIRKVDTKKRKRQRKEAQESLKQQTAAFLNHPTECCLCQTTFERNKITVKEWQVTVVEERVRLTCPDCWLRVGRLIECQE